MIKNNLTTWAYSLEQTALLGVRYIQERQFSRRKLRAKYVIDRFLKEARKLESNERFLDIGCGSGAHTKHVSLSGIFKEIHCIDYSNAHRHDGHITGDYLNHKTDEKYDAIWTSHTLEHIRNPGLFLDKIHNDLKEGGLLGICVPPLKSAITVGHVTLWTPGLLLHNLVQSGFDCSDVLLKQQGYNIGVVLRKRTCPTVRSFAPNVDASARPFLPAQLSWFQNQRTGIWYFRGNIESINW